MMNSEFVKQSRGIAEDFLQSVVVVDDYGQLDKDHVSPEPAPSEELQPPPERPVIGAGKPSLQIAEEEPMRDEKPEPPHEAKNGEERFSAQKVIGSFADKGIACAVLAPQGDEDLGRLSDTVSKLAPTSDVLILDWALGDAGGRTLTLIQNLVYHDENNRDRLRLIVIYTIDNRALHILNEIFKGIKGIPDGPDIEKNVNEYSLHIGATKIVILLKEAARVPRENTELVSRQVPFERLADRVVDEFTEMTHGLVPNVALQSIAEIRDNTSKLLARFNGELDAPYLTHRTLLPDPEDAEDHLVALISAELSTLLEEREVRRGANIEAIGRWVEDKRPGNATFTLDTDPDPCELTKQDVIQLLKKGISKVDKHDYPPGLKTKHFEKPHTIKLSKMYHCDDASSADLDERFAELFTIKSFYGRPNPRLSLGTIIKAIDSGIHHICIQPRCDCVRIRQDTAFIFLPLMIETLSGKFDIVLKDNDSYVRLRTDKKSNSITLIKFPADSQGRGAIIASEDTGGYYFEDAEGIKYKWIGELRGEQALRLSNEFSSELCRVGLDESEWLRLHAKQQR